MVKLKNSKKSLWKSENMHRALLENLPQKIFLIDKNLVFVSCNKSFAQDKKISPEEIAGKTDYNFFSKKMAEKYRADDRRIIKSGKTEEIEDKYVINGREFTEYTIKCPAKDKRGNIIGLLGISWDITKRKETEEKIRESENLFRQVMENANDWIWVLDTHGNFVVANKRAETVSGHKLKDLKKKSFAPFIHPDDLKMTNRVFRKTLLGNRQQYTVKIYDKNGKIIILSVNTAPMYKMGKIKGTVSFGRDITKRMETEKKLQKQKLALEQKNIALSEIIAQIEVEKRKMKDNIAANVNELLLPILEKLKLENTSDKYIDLLKTHLGELVSSFGRKIREKRLNLTPREIEICDMIKGKLTSKEISALLNISYQTVEKHRKNIRHKMGISKKDINLISFLQTI